MITLRAGMCHVSACTQVMGTAALLSGRGRFTLGFTSVMSYMSPERLLWVSCQCEAIVQELLWVQHGVLCILAGHARGPGESGSVGIGSSTGWGAAGLLTGREVPSGGHRSTFTLLWGKRGFSQFHKLRKDGQVVHTHVSPVVLGQHTEQTIYHNTLRNLHSGGFAREQIDRRINR